MEKKMRVDGVNFNSSNVSSIKKSGNVAGADEIKSILFLGIKSDIPAGDTKRKVDIII